MNEKKKIGRASACLMTLYAMFAAGCASVPMKQVKVITAPPPETVLVTFVRQSIFAGDGIKVDVWDGTHYIGPLAAGTLVQYRTTPGEHLFVGAAENWSYATGSLVAGKQYFIKANMFPGIGVARVAWGVAEATDQRIPKWRKWKAMAPDQAKRAAFETKSQTKIEGAVQKFRDGAISSFADIKPENAL
jgi:hypothetical protein